MVKDLVFVWGCLSAGMPFIVKCKKEMPAVNPFVLHFVEMKMFATKGKGK